MPPALPHRARGWALLPLLALALTACPAAPTSTGADAGPEDGGGVDGSETDGGVTSCLPLSGEGTPLATDLKGPRRLAADAAHLYVSVTGTPTEPQGRVVRVPLPGGLVEELATGLTAPDAIAVDQGVVFVADTNGVWRIDPANGERARVDATANNAAFGETGVVPAGDSVLFATAQRWLVKARTDGSGSTRLYEGAPGESVRGLAVSGAEVFFLVSAGSAPGLYRVPLDGSAAAARVSGQPADGISLALDGDRLLWTDGAGRLGSVARDGSDLKVLADGLQRPAHPARAGGAVYFKDRTAAPSQDFFQALGPCGLEPVGPLGVGPGDVLFHDGVLFFSSQELGGNGYVSRLP